MEKNITRNIKAYIFHDKNSNQDQVSILGKIKRKDIVELNKTEYKYDNLSEVTNFEEYNNEELCRMYQIGNENALSYLINKNKRLVYSRVMKYYKMYRHDLTVDDLFQEGCIGILKAVDKFDYSLGFKFSTYATNWIDQSISRAIADKGYTIRVPVHMFDNINKYNKLSKELENNNIELDDRGEYLREITGFKSEQLKDITNISNNILNMSSLNIKVGEVEDTELISFLKSESEENPLNIVTENHLIEEVGMALQVLNDRERDILSMRFGLNNSTPKTLEEIGLIYDLTRERIRQIEKNAIVKLKKSKDINALKAFLSDK